MDERFPDEFVTWHHKTPLGVKVDEIFGMDSKSGRVWTELARQIYCEQGIPNYREIDHFENGAPFLCNYPGRISLSHTSHLFVVATLPKTPEVNLDSFNPRAALGIDAEPIDRKQVLKVRSKFLSEEEMRLIPEDDVQSNVLAWTSKEALYKAAMTPGLDFIKGIQIVKLPELSPDPTNAPSSSFGEAKLHLPNYTNNICETPISMKLFSYESYGCCVTITISYKSANFGKQS